MEKSLNFFISGEKKKERKGIIFHGVVGGWGGYL
jgi:hypothetical protein